MSAARTTYETLLVELDRSVALITLNRPDRLNAFDQQMTRELFEALGAFDADESVRAVVVTGAGRAFSAGADLDGGFGEQAHDAEASAGAPARPLALDFRPWEMRTPILAAINGAAVGVGLTYPLMWDIRIAAEDAKLGLVFTRRGLLPEGSSLWLLARLVGASRALELLLTGRMFSGNEAALLPLPGPRRPYGGAQGGAGGVPLAGRTDRRPRGAHRLPRGPCAGMAADRRRAALVSQHDVRANHEHTASLAPTRRSLMREPKASR
jgi:hypothetical protein